MQTFLPFPDFQKSATCLDRARLGKQRVEVLQLLKALHGEPSTWTNHPCAKMWKGYEGALTLYGEVICKEWIKRGYRDTCYEKIYVYDSSEPRYPLWLGDEVFHESHRSNLLRKDYNHYIQFFTAPLGLPYVWPKL